MKTKTKSSIKAKSFYSRRTATKELISIIQELENHLNWMMENDQTLDILQIDELTSQNIVDSFNNIQQMFDELTD